MGHRGNAVREELFLISVSLVVCRKATYFGRFGRVLLTQLQFGPHATDAHLDSKGEIDFRP